MNKALIAALLLITFIAGMGIGFALTPEYALMREQKSAPMMELGTPDRYLDLRYIDGMIAHHLSAIYMLEQAQKHSKRPEVKALADSVIAADKEGIKKLYAYKKEWYGNTRQVTQFQKVNVGSADAQFDLRLINALLSHHEEAITVAKEVQSKSSRTEVLGLADSVISALSANAETLKEWRKEWYGI